MHAVTDSESGKLVGKDNAKTHTESTAKRWRDLSRIAKQASPTSRHRESGPQDHHRRRTRRQTRMNFSSAFVDLAIVRQSAEPATKASLQATVVALLLSPSLTCCLVSLSGARASERSTNWIRIGRQSELKRNRRTALLGNRANATQDTQNTPIDKDPPRFSSCCATSAWYKVLCRTLGARWLTRRWQTRRCSSSSSASACVGEAWHL